MRLEILTVLFLGSFFSVVTTVSSSPHEVGRLPDGRAYRVDEEGNQLVDYIAELELNVDTMNHQIKALENDVTAKEKTIENIQRQNPRDENINKTDNDAVKDKIFQDIQAKSQTVNEDTKQKELLEKQLSATKQLLAEQKIKVEELEKKIAVKISQQEEERAAIKSNIVNKESTINSLAAKSSEQDKLIEQLKEQLSQKTKESELQTKTLEAQLNASKEAESALKAHLAEVKLSNKPVTKISPEIPFSSIKEEITVDDDISAQQKVVQKEVNESPRGSINFDQTPQLDSQQEIVKKRIRVELSKLVSLAASRNQLFNRYGSRANGLTVKPSDLVTADGEDLNSVQDRIASAFTNRDMSLIAKDISSLRSIVEKDMQYIRRFQR